jgi:hypothetical protein
MNRSTHIHRLIAVAAVGLLAACGSSTDAAAPSTTRPAPTTNASTTGAPTTTAADSSTFDSAGLADFPVRMQVEVGSEWRALTDVPATITFVHLGTPPEDQSQWWGPGVVNVDDAVVHDPATAVSTEPASASKEDFVPWPDDFFAYVTALPGVSVRSGPEPITIGGVEGTQLTVDTPEMHPLIWTAADSMWLGGGSTGVDPVMTRHYALLEVDGHRLLFEFDTSPTVFDERLPMVKALYDTIRFGA